MSQKIISVENNVTGRRVLEILAEGRKIADNPSTDAELQSGEWKNRRDSYPRWTSTIIVNETPGKALGAMVEYKGIIFEVPKEYRKMKDIAMVFDSSTIRLTKQGRLTGKILAAQSYPGKDGWYLPDKTTGIPTAAERSPSDSEARYLWRASGARIGPVGRGFFDAGCASGWRYVLVGIYSRLDIPFDVAFVGEADQGIVQTGLTKPAVSAESGEKAREDLADTHRFGPSNLLRSIKKSMAERIWKKYVLK
jgi:hypothetical protein